jgi:hypothetical protein
VPCIKRNRTVDPCTTLVITLTSCLSWGNIIYRIVAGANVSLAFFLKRRNSSSHSLRLNGLILLSSCENIYLEARDVLLAGYYEKLFANMLRASLLFSSW